MANPILNDKFIENEKALDGQVMTINGTIQITLFLTLCLLLSACFVWQKFALGYNDIALTLTSIGGIVGFISALIICFMRIKYLVPVYAICEGLCLGGISATMENSYPGVVMHAVFGTVMALVSMLLLYNFKIIKASDKFRSVIFISTLSIAGIYLIDFIGHFFNFAIPAINTASPIGIGFSFVVVAIAALNLILDFDFIEKGANAMLPKDYEWFGAFGLMVTLVWLYLEILRLLAKLQSRR